MKHLMKFAAVLAFMLFGMPNAPVTAYFVSSAGEALAYFDDGPQDSDGDGFMDHVDQCPGEYGTDIV